jgi:hypothetical protein
MSRNQELTIGNQAFIAEFQELCNNLAFSPFLFLIPIKGLKINNLFFPQRWIAGLIFASQL